MQPIEQIQAETLARFQAVYPYKDADRSVMQGGYYRLRLPRHPAADEQGYVLEHRAAVEEHLRRFLYRHEQVHHKDRNRKNNAIDNLEVYQSVLHHLAEHARSNMPQSVIDAVLAGAADRTVALSDLPCAPATARKILAKHNVVWVSPIGHKLDEHIVKRALASMKWQDAARHLGLSLTKFWYDWRYLIQPSRNIPGFLDDYRDTIFAKLRAGHSVRKIAAECRTNGTTLQAAIGRWKANGELPLDVEQRAKFRRKNKYAPQHKPVSAWAEWRAQRESPKASSPDPQG